MPHHNAGGRSKSTPDHPLSHRAVVIALRFGLGWKLKEIKELSEGV